MYEIFAKLLEERGITPYRVSVDTGVSQGSLSDWKRGKSKPKYEKLVKIAEYFDVSVDYLLGKEKDPSEKSGRPSEEDIKIALFGGDGEITDEMWEEAKQFAKFIKERETKKKG